MEKNDKLELRMYGLVNYQLSGIQKGIQFGHAVVEYGRNCEGMKKMKALYKEWADNWKTFIILNGGTTNTKTSIEDGMPFGSLNKHLLTLQDIGVPVATFHEPDLGDQLTAIVFIVDERVFNKGKYPDIIFMDEFETNWATEISDDEFNKIMRLREFLSAFRLA
jgi:hypothetical protein